MLGITQFRNFCEYIYHNLVAAGEEHMRQDVTGVTDWRQSIPVIFTAFRLNTGKGSFGKLD